MTETLIDSTMEEDSAEFSRAVRSALSHLYDNAYLQTHPLTVMWTAGSYGDRLSQAQDLRRSLLDCIERLRPHATAPGDAARVYAVLSYRCINGLTIEEIEQKLGLSRRQVYRELTKGINAVAEQLLDLLEARGARTQQVPSETTPVTSRRELAEVELERLTKAVQLDAVLLPTVVEGVCRLLVARLEQRSMAVDIALPGSVPPVLADRTLLRQALLNLLSYGLDVLPNGATLQVSAGEAEGVVRVTVRRNLAAIAQSGGHATPPQRREGVTLQVAQSLIAAQNGRLVLEESADDWSAEILLPTAQTPTILLIDDNQALIDLFQRYLAGHRVVVHGTTSGTAALRLVRQAAPQAIVLDVMMPHQDGWEILQALRQEQACATVPIIVCSVLREHDLALSLGANDTLVKPVNQPALLTVLRRWLGILHPVESLPPVWYREAQAVHSTQTPARAES